MLDYFTLEASSDFPEFLTIFYTIVLAFILSSIIALTHLKTSRELVPSIEFLQSIVLVSIVSATVMQAIGDSLARGLGMLGALAIIRYRVTLKTPRNMVFTFATLAAGIACGVYAFVIALTGTIGFCIVAIALRYSPFSKLTSLQGVLKFQHPIDYNDEQVLSIIQHHCNKFKKVKFQLGNSKKQLEETSNSLQEILSVEYELSFIGFDESKSLFQAISKLESISQAKLTFEKITENV